MTYILQEIDGNEGYDEELEVLYYITREEIADIWDMHDVKEHDMFWEDRSRKEQKEIEKTIIKEVHDFVYFSNLPGSPNKLRARIEQIMCDMEK